MSYPTDKWATGLVEVYRERFSAWADRPIRLLEIGIDRGGSLLFWADLFRHPQAAIIGLDLQPPPGPWPDRVKALAGDQNDRRRLSQIAQEHGPFDLIIDDGSHFARETRHCFETLYGPALKVGGCYVIEDWAVGYWRGRDARYVGMVEFVAELLQRAPQLSMSAVAISLKPGQAYALFEKGATGWQA